MKPSLLKLKKLKKTSILLLLVVLMPAFGADPQVLVLKDSIITFKLKSNPSTGYKWKVVSFDNKELQFIKSDYLAANNHLMGSSGFEQFYFKRIKDSPLHTKIKLIYHRPWQKGGQIEIVEIDVK